MLRNKMARAAKAAVTLLVIAGACLASVGQTLAAPPSNDPALAAELAATWSARLVNAQGFVPLPDTSPNITATLETALALGAARVEKPTFDRIVNWLAAHIETAIVDGGNDDPGNIGEMLMIAGLAGLNPSDVAGVNLVDRLSNTLGDLVPGLFGAQDPSYDGVYRQALALVGLGAVGSTVPPEAVAWLASQQCSGSPAAAAGGWQAYRANLALPCDAPDPVNFVGPDTNSTALAVQALVASGARSAVPSALSFLAAAESGAGGFAFISGLADDPNSTSLVIQAILAAGEDPRSGRWVASAGDPMTSLLSWQLGCAATEGDRGAFASPFSSGAPDAFATRQAVWGAAMRPFPLATGTFHPAALPCQSTTTTTAATTTRMASTTSSAPLGASPSTTTVEVSAAGAVVAVPRFTG